MKPKLSIIVPVFNVEKYLVRCIDSILAQTYTDFELILIDDGSKDRSGEICDDYTKKDNRIKVIHKENGGSSDARNAGIDIAGADYIGFVDADDYIEPAMYESILPLMLKHGTDIGICGFNVVNEDRKILEQRRFFVEEGAHKIFSQDDALKELLEIPETIFGYVWNKVFHKNILKGIKFSTEIIIGEDMLFLFKALMKAEKCIYISACYYNYFLSKESLLRSDSFRIAPQLLKVSEYILIKVKEQKPFLLDYALRKYCGLGIYVIGLEYKTKDVNLKATVKEIRKVFKNNFVLIATYKAIPVKLRLISCLFAINESIYYWLLRAKQKFKF